MHLAASNEWIFFMAEASTCSLSLEQVVHSPSPGKCSDMWQCQYYSPILKLAATVYAFKNTAASTCQIRPYA